MPRQVFDVFLSSTAGDLAPFRAKVREMVERLEQSSICMETFGARPDRPLEACRQKVESADALVVIVGHRYGWVPSSEEGGDGKKSITWWEVQWALDAGKPVYAYLIDRNTAGKKEQDRLEDEVGDDEQALWAVFNAVRQLQAFRAFLESKTTREQFTSADDLGGKVATSLANWLRHSRETAAGAAADGRPAPAPREPPWTGSPFPGLRTFTPLDAPIFFGRDRETRFLIAKLCETNCRFLLVVGASGSGKSSLVAAGLIPRLAEGAIPGSENWLLPAVQRVGRGHVWLGLRMTPGARRGDPFEALAESLAPMVGSEMSSDEVAQLLHAQPERASTLLEQALSGSPPSAEALIFVDQFEELITLVVDEDRRARFVDLLSRLARWPRSRIVGTVRADFYHRCIEAQPALAELLRDCGATVPLAVPGASALRAMIEGPAARARLRFDDGLIDDLVDQTVKRPGGLALLAFALEELYKAPGEGHLSRAAFQSFGGLAGVIKTRAETTFAGLDQAVQKSLGAVFSRLVAVDEHDVATRQRESRKDIVGASPEAATLVDRFVDGRLLVSDDGGVVEVAHEVLLREWPLLAEWIRERADDIRLMRQVEAAAREWDRQGRQDAYAWPHERLVPVSDSLKRLGRGVLAEPVQSFVRPEAERLVAELKQPVSTHARRAFIGDRLELIGDPRSGVGVRNDRPDICWRDVPAGNVTLEGTRATAQVQPFQMAQYPVTNAQFYSFIAAHGYQNAEWWDGMPGSASSDPVEPRFSGMSHPRENVSWYEAVAFCRWLSHCLEFEVRLPTEFEWQQAATGGDRTRKYPWLGDWDAGRCNSSNNELNRTTSVGMYPEGKSFQGVDDLAGNVWEWCLNKYDDPTQTAVDGTDDWRGLRGGSWLDPADHCRAAFRGLRHNRLTERLRGASVGFRVIHPGSLAKP